MELHSNRTVNTAPVRLRPQTVFFFMNYTRYSHFAPWDLLMNFLSPAISSGRLGLGPGLAHEIMTDSRHLASHQCLTKCSNSSMNSTKVGDFSFFGTYPD